MPNISVENRNIFESSLRTGVNLFLGSGFSTLAKNSQGYYLPTEGELTSKVASEFGISIPSGLSLEQVCAIVKNKAGKDKLVEYLKLKLSVLHYDKRYESLKSINIKSIITINIDDLIYNIFSEGIPRYIHNVNSKGLIRDNDAIDFVPIRGTISDNDDTEIINIMPASDFDKPRVIAERIQKYPTVFWGFGIEDTRVLQEFVARAESTQYRWIVLDPSQDSSAEFVYKEAYGFQIISSSIPDSLEYLSELGVELGRGRLQRTSMRPEELFGKSALVPKPESLPFVRSIDDFFLGHVPEWSDIFSGRLHKTKHFTRVMNEIMDPSGASVIILGIPGCGKTTLLMQLASQNFSRNYKLWYHSLNRDQARLITNKLNGARALVFLDNFADSIEAFNDLSNEQNIQVVGADRYYNYDIISDLVSSNSKEPIDVTDLEEDIQACIASIPDSIRIRSPLQQNNQPAQVSLFEIIDQHVYGSTLRSRYKHVLDELARKDEDLRDLLIVISYLDNCRVPTTLDLLLAYFRGITNDYKDIYEMIRQLENIIFDIAGQRYNDDRYGEDQDYYVPRSQILGDAVIKSVKGTVFKDVLKRFHDNVSPQRIHNFHIFKKNGYDKDIISTAFHNADEGKDFYEKLYSRDQTPELLQQAALYLSYKKRHQGAFHMIDRAIAAKPKSWSIKNSHAIILFKANIDSPDAPQAKRELGKSMKILTDCYKFDKKSKPFHAKKFADYAKQYSKIHGGNEAKNYLETSQNWLAEQKLKFPWDKSIQNLLKEIIEELRKY
jgi:GTPase SAR1 family protein